MVNPVYYLFYITNNLNMIQNTGHYVPLSLIFSKSWEMSKIDLARTHRMNPCKYVQ